MSAKARVRVERREPAALAGTGPRGRRRRPPGVPLLVERALRGGGRLLDPATRSAMESALGHRFDDIRIHTGADAAAAAGALDADAVTLGQDILFGAGRYRPDVAAGRGLLAHELAHSLQDGGAAAGQAPLAVAAPPRSRDDPLEREADTAASRVAAGGQVPAGLVTVAAPGARDRVALAPTTPEQLAPAEVPDSPEAVRDVTDEVARLFAFDPDDLFGRVRRRLARLAPLTRRALAAQLQGRIPAAAQERLGQLLTELAPVDPQAGEPAEAPVDAAERAGVRRPGQPEPVEAAVTPVMPAAAAPATGAEALGGGLAEPGAEAVPEAPTEEPEAAAPVPDLQEAPPEAAPGPAPAEPAPAPAEAGGEAAGAAEPAAAAGAVAESVGVETPAGAVPEAEVEAEEPDAEGEGEPGEPEAEAAPAEEPPPPVPAAEAAPATETEAEAAPAEAAPASVEAPAEEAAPAEAEPAEVEEEAPAAEGEAPEAVAGEVAAAGLEPPPAAEAGAPEAEDREEDVGPAAAGGGGGVPIPDAPEPEVPDVSAAEPEQAMATVAALPPAQLQAGLAGVSAASSRSVGEQRAALAADPPALERPSGAPTAAERAAEEEAAPPPPAAPARVERAPQAPAPPPVRPPVLPPPGAPPTERVKPPEVVGGPNGDLSQDDARALQASVRSLPTRDPALEETAAPPPPLVLEGSADPRQARAQREHLERASQQAQAEGHRDVNEPMGEHQLYPEVAPETLRAEVGAAAPPPAPGPAATAPAGGAPAAATPAAEATVAAGGSEAAVSIVAQQERGAELRAAAAAGRAEMAAQRQQQQAKAAEAHARSKQEVAELVQGSVAEQAAERRGARTAVYEHRREWSGEQRSLVERASADADTESRRGAEEITDRQQTAEREAAAHIERGNQDAAAARREGEERATRERERGERESSGDGFFGWLAKRARAFFDEIKRGIQQAFEWARAAVRRAIQAAQRLAAEVIDRARQAIVAAIRRVGDALIAIGDRLLTGFPALRDRFRRAIRERVERAVARVNQLADALKAGVQRALNVLGAALEFALGQLERGLLAAVDTVNRVVQGAIRFARSVVQALAAFAALIRDIAAHPIQWLRNLGSSVVDGIRNHLWRALKRAIQEWFDQKLEEVLGLGLAIWNLLRHGGITLGAIGRMVWAGLKAIIPRTLIQILVEKLVAMIVPAAGAVMVIIEGLKAAWGTVSRILQAFERFFAFLRAVKTGRAGPQFADAVAAAAVAVIDFVANWLLQRLRRPAGAIASRIRALAQRIGRRLRGLTRALRQGFRRITARVRRFFGRRRARRRPHESQRRADRERRRRERQEAARQQTTRVLSGLLARGVSGLRLKAQLLFMKLRYRWRTLALRRKGTARFVIVGGFSPASDLVEGEEQWEIRRVLDYHLRGVPTTGAEWEQAVMPYVHGPLAHEIAAGRPFEFTVPPSPTLGLPASRTHRYRSTLDLLRFVQQRQIRLPQQRRKPEAYVEIPREGPGGTREVQAVHVIEATLAFDFTARNIGAAHKRLQIPETLHMLKQRYGTDISIFYQMIVPSSPTQATRKFVMDQLGELGMRNVRFVWRVIPL